MSATQSAGPPRHEASPERMKFELDEATTEMVRKLAQLLGVRAMDVIAKAIANEAFIVGETRNGRRFQLCDDDKVGPVNFV
jgi:hypothetical protein